MEIELLEFYPFEISEKKTQGTLRIRIPHLAIELLGIQYLQQRDKLFIRLPGRKGVHHETGKPCWFPFIVFDDQAKMGELITELKKVAPAFIEDRLKHLSIPNRNASNIKPKPQKDNATSGFKTAHKLNPQSISMKGWQDVPRKTKMG